MMTRFSWRGRDASGGRVEGTLEAPSVEAVIAQLQRQRIVPVSVEEQVDVRPVSSGISLPWQRKKVSLDDLSMFCRQMHALSRAGMPVVQSIAGLAELTRSERLREALQMAAVRLRAGVSLAAALREHPDVFSDIFVAMVNVGENTGRMDHAFKKLIDHLEIERMARGQLAQAFRYPLLVVVAMSLAMIVINIFVIPNFSKVFARLGRELPLPTQLLMMTSHLMIEWWWAMVIAIVAIVFATLRYLEQPRGREVWDRNKLRLPVVGPVFERIVLSRFARTFAMLTEAGVPVVQALAAVSSTVGNVWIRNGVDAIRRGVERGDSVTRSAASAGIFTPLILQMMAVGEETGTLDVLLHDVADFYEQEVSFALKRLSEAIEPIVLAFLGMMVLVLALGVFLPMWELSSATFH